MKAKLIFDLDDEGDAYNFRRAAKANEFYSCLMDIWNSLRNRKKHGEEMQNMEEIYGEFLDVMNSYSIDYE